MNRRDFLNRVGVSAIGAATGVALGSVMIAIPAAGNTRAFCNLCGSPLLTMGCSNSACEASHAPVQDDDAMRSQLRVGAGKP